MQIYSKSQKKKCFFSFLSRPILIWFALFGRAKFDIWENDTSGNFFPFWDWLLRKRLPFLFSLTICPSNFIPCLKIFVCTEARRKKKKRHWECLLEDDMNINLFHFHFLLFRIHCCQAILFYHSQRKTLKKCVKMISITSKSHNEYQ